MACVTLKRPLEFDPIYNSPGGPGSCSPRPHKRRRCLPMCIPASHVSNTSSAPAFSASSFAALPRTSLTTTTPKSPFTNAAPALLQGDIAQYVREEIRRLKRRRLLPASTSSSTVSTDIRSTMDVEVPSSSPRTTSPPTPHTSTSSPSSKEKPLFSFRQVNQLCSQLLRDRENKIREEYDTILAHELSEQYNRCVRFTSDQIHKLSNQELPSYLS